MKIAFISDTHCKHAEIDSQLRGKGIDILIHSGDGSNHKERVFNNNELRDCLAWMESFSNIKHKIYVPGNHDTSLESGLVRKDDFKSINILINESLEIIGEKIIKIYGSPITPSFGTGWAYNCKRNKIDKYWNMIPNDTNILVTHGPAKGILDKTEDFDRKIVNVGCKALFNKIMEVQPMYHAFGHLHDEYGFLNHGTKTLGEKCKTTFINSSIVNLKHRVVNGPIIIDYKF